MEYHVHWLLNSSCFGLSGDGKYGLFWAKKLMERWYLLVTGKFLFWTVRKWEIRYFFEPKSWWRRRYLLGLFELSMMFYWEKCFFVQCKIHYIRLLSHGVFHEQSLGKSWVNFIMYHDHKKFFLSCAIWKWFHKRYYRK